jgi:glycerol kinase
MARYVLALDAGTTSSRSILFDHAGSVIAHAQREFTQHFPHPGWVEHDAQEIWRTQLATIDDVLAQAGVNARDIAAVGITNQRETTVFWDRVSGEPVAPAIVWQDRRTAEVCANFKQRGVEPRVSKLTGLLLDPYFSATKLAWLLDHVPNARARAANGELAFGTIDSWLAFKLSNGQQHITDVSNASRTLLFDLTQQDWSAELLALFDIPAACLPRIVASSGIAASAYIQGVAVPLAGIAGDQQAALYGQTCFKAGSAKNTYGTGCFLLMNCGPQPRASAQRLLTTVAWQLSGQKTHYALEGSVFSAGSAVQWLRDGLGVIKESAEVEALAATVPDNGGVYLVPAFTGLGCPYWDPTARGSLQGLTRGSTRAHIARATLESIALQSALVLDAMQQDTGQTLTELRVDGGAAANNLLLQFQADLLGVPVLRSRILETTALGAAYLAGLAVGFWKSEAELAQQWQLDRVFEPAMAAAQVVQLRGDWQKAAQRSLGWVNSAPGLK